MVVEFDKKNILKITDELKDIVSRISGINQSEMELERKLISYGLDSLLLMALAKQIDIKYKLQIPLNLFFSTLNTLDLLVEYIAENGHLEETEELPVHYNQDSNNDYLEWMPDVATPEELLSDSTLPLEIGDGNIDKMVSVFVGQYNVMSRQNEIIRLMAGVPKKNPHVKPIAKAIVKPIVKPKEDKPLDYYTPYRKLEITQEDNLDEHQLEYIKSIENKLNILLKNSKEQTQKYRKVSDDYRNVGGFRLLYKEMLYQIIADQGKGSKVIDIDGNQMIDLTMGFGALLLGHSPDFLRAALAVELEKGMPLGSMGRLTGQVADYISQLTGVERVFFCNSGSEAVMFAARVARAVNGKDKIVCFKGSYHGTYDGVVGIPVNSDDPDKNTISLVPGITDHAVCDLILLDYDSEEALQYIEAHSDIIAAVMVEPVQSRRPDIQPKQFLKKLRLLTEKSGMALIFDEMVTGFRIGAGGAQEYFGIEADIVTYGKTVGGGAPIGIVAGKSEYMDSIDGGMWSFGDDSAPPYKVRRTFVAGTFCHNPISMAAAHAVLHHISENKDQLYPDLNQKTTKMVTELNEFFEQEAVSIHIDHFASLFRFKTSIDNEIFFYSLLHKGIYIWEGRNCFLSTEHGSEDIRHIIDAVKKTIYEMKDAGFFTKGRYEE